MNKDLPYESHSSSLRNIAVVVLLSLSILLIGCALAKDSSGKILSPDSVVHSTEYLVTIDLNYQTGKHYYLADHYGVHGWYAQLESIIPPFSGVHEVHLKLDETDFENGKVYSLVLVEADDLCKKRIDKKWADHPLPTGANPIKGFKEGCKLLDMVSLKQVEK